MMLGDHRYELPLSLWNHYVKKPRINISLAGRLGSPVARLSYSFRTAGCAALEHGKALGLKHEGFLLAFLSLSLSSSKVALKPLFPIKFTNVNLHFHSNKVQTQPRGKGTLPIATKFVNVAACSWLPEAIPNSGFGKQKQAVVLRKEQHVSFIDCVF